MLAQQNPDQGLISGSRYLSFQELTTRARQAAAGLHDLGVWEGDRIALLLRNDFAVFEATFGTELLGASPVPMNWHLSPQEIEYILDDCGAKVLVAHSDLLTEAVLAVCSGVEVIAVPVPDEIIDAYSIKQEATKIPGGVPNWSVWIEAYDEWHDSPRRIAGPMFYTSGTTGRPKGVMRKNAQPDVVEAIQERTKQAWGFDQPVLRSIMTGPLYHSAPNAFGMHIVRSGGLLVLQPRFNSIHLLSLIQQYQITHLHMVPTMFVRLLGLSEDERRKYDLKSLTFVTHGAAPCPTDVKTAMIDWWGEVINEYYAMTEIGIVTFCGSREWLENPGTVGRAGPGVDIRIVDDQGNTQDRNKVGEICVRSETTTRFTYHRAEEKTAAVRVGDYVATGDVGYLNENGYLFISDRKTDMVISGGVNIYPAEIEKVLVTLPHIVDCAVFGVPDRQFGERLVAVIQPTESVTEEEVTSQLRQRIAAYKIPRDIRFASRLPREDSGKIKKHLLRDQYIADKLTQPSS